MQALTLGCLILCCCYNIHGCPQMAVDALWKDGLCASTVPDAVKTKRLECIMGKIPPDVLQVKQSCKESFFQGLNNLQVLKQQCSNSTLEKQYYSCVQQNLGLPDWEDGCKAMTDNIGMGMPQQNSFLSGQQPMNNQQQSFFNPTSGQLQFPSFNGQQFPFNRQQFQNMPLTSQFPNSNLRQQFSFGGAMQPFPNGGLSQQLPYGSLIQRFPNQYFQQQLPITRMQTQQMLSSNGGTSDQMADVAKKMLWDIAVCFIENRNI
ncbi:uncharacterized protein LOC143238196 [Tachypleus tridentatus]|uniref:uncharacterized protein LOC143238196 n=1 Tax=Tachypleus tridentatus TaxID=6853 RepID=UPI003FD2A063